MISMSLHDPHKIFRKIKLFFVIFNLFNVCGEGGTPRSTCISCPRIHGLWFPISVISLEYPAKISEEHRN